jgi:probable HAF family extracellular repeat protein
VGYSENSTFTDSAFLWQDGVMTDLNSLLPADSGWNLTYAGFINDAGQVVGYGSYFGEFSWYLLSTKAPNRPPVAVAVASPTVECPNPVLVDGSQSSDPDRDPLTFEWREGSTVLGSDPTLSVNLPVGSHLITLTVTDPAGASSQAAVTVTVLDSTAPVIRSAVVSPNTLGQPNRQMVPVQVNVVASDSCDPAPSCRILAITSSDPVTGAGDNTSPDWLITGPLTAQLRAERSPRGGDRIYTLTIQCADAAGNASSTHITMVVPKSGKH